MRTYLTVLVFISCLGTFAPTSARAQAPAAAQAAADMLLVTATTDIARPVKRQSQRDPLVRSGLTLPEPQLTLEATKGKGRATGTVGFVKQQTNGELTVGLAVSSPIGESDDAEAQPLDLRGLSNGAVVAFNVAGSSLFKTFRASDVRAVCKKRNIPTADCTAGKLEDTDPETSQELLNLAFRKVPLLYGASFSYGRNSFTFFDATGTKQDPVHHDDLQFEASLGLLVNGRRDLFAFHIDYADVAKASSSKTQLCRPLTGSTVSRCDSATIGAPTEEQKLIGTIEYRWQKRGNPRLPLAFAPKFQFSLGFDDADDVTAFEAPFYFFQDKPKDTTAAPKLNGGISAGWRSDTGFEAAVFIGTTFSLFKL